MKKLIVYMTMLIVICFSTTVHADHMEVKPVTPVIKDGIEYSAPHHLMGYVVAKRVEDDREIWKRQIYEIKYEGELEADVQWIFITHLAIEGENLLIVNERWQRFIWNLKTHTLTDGEVECLYPTVANDQHIYASSTAGMLYAINSDGHTKWIFNLSGKPTSPPSSGKDGIIYASTPEALYAINPDGVLKWEFRLPQNSKGSFSVVGNDGTIYLGTKAGIIYAISPDRKVNWEFNTRGIMWYPPIVSNEGMIYAVSIQQTGKGYGYKGQVYAINKDGSQKWMIETMDSEGRTPVIGDDDTIYVSEHYNKLYAITPKGVVKWEMEFGGGPFIVAGPDKNLYAFNSPERTLYKIKSDGTKELLFKTGGYGGLGLPSVGADKMIIMVSEENSGTLFSVFPSGSLKWKYYLNSNSTGYGFLGSLAFDNNGTVYVGYRGKFYGTLTAIDSDGNKKWEFTTRE
jgi:outer membrane protein assembly factor BamB